MFLDTGKLFTDVIVKKYSGGFVIKLSDRKYKGGKTVAEIGALAGEGNKDMKARPFSGLIKEP